MAAERPRAGRAWCRSASLLVTALVCVLAVSVSAADEPNGRML
jgi:hypothetical protein